MVRILLIVPDSSYRTAAFSRAAEKLKFEYTIASTGGVHSPIESGIGIALRSLQPAEMLAVILEQHKRTPFDGVIGTDDSTVGLAAKVAAHLNLRVIRLKAFEQQLARTFPEGSLRNLECRCLGIGW